MKQSKLTLCLLTFVVMLMVPATVKTSTPAKPSTDFTMYYWFDASDNYLFRQNMILDEMALTGLDESIQNPKTLQEKGWKPASVSVDGSGTPTPITPSPDKKLYSHP